MRLPRTSTSLLAILLLLGTWSASIAVGTETQQSETPQVATMSMAKGGAAFATLSPNADHSRVSGRILLELQRSHYRSVTVDDDLSADLLDSYIESLDPYRRYFLASDVERFERYRVYLDDAMRKGDLGPAFEIYQVWMQRRLERFEFLADALENKFDELRFDIDETLETGRENSPWLESKEEADELWRKYFKDDVLRLRLADRDEESILDVLGKRYENQLHLIRQGNSDDAFRTYMNIFTMQYDPHTEYFPPRKAENFDIEMSLSLEGIGALLEPFGEYTRIARLIPGGPAEKDGRLQALDRIVSVGQGASGEFTDIVGWRLDDVVQLVRGKKGSMVRLQVLTADQPTSGETTIIEIVRDRVKLEEQSAKKEIVEIERDGKKRKVGIIRLPAFYIDFDAARAGDKNFKSSSRDVAKLLDELKAENVDGVVVDLRDNGGGSLYEARQLTGLFMRYRPVVQVRSLENGTARTEVQPAGSLNAHYTGPLAVMINRLSASASEIFAGAIQDYGRGIVVGTRTFGKGTVQNLAPLEDGQLKLTQAKFYRVSGASTQERGVAPDIAFPSMHDVSEIGESGLDNPLPWDEIEPARGYFKDPKLGRAMPKLREQHEARVAEDSDFRFLSDWFAYNLEARNKTEISLNEAKRKAERKIDEKRRLAIENRRRVAAGKKPIESFDELDDEKDAETTDTDKIDAFARETANIVLDYADISKRPIRTVKR